MRLNNFMSFTRIQTLKEMPQKRGIPSAFSIILSENVVFHEFFENPGTRVPYRKVPLVKEVFKTSGAFSLFRKDNTAIFLFLTKEELHVICSSGN